MSSLLDRIKKVTKVEKASVMSETEIFSDLDHIQTAVPIINIALSGDLEGGLTSGITAIAGKSKHFKSKYAIEMVAAYLRKYDDAVCIFFDSEFGSPPEYFQSSGVDISRVYHVPVTTVEQFRNVIMNQLEEMARGDRVVFLVDSLSNIGSTKETEDALSDKNVADMTRAKVLKSVFRLITPKIKLLNVPAILVAHVYNTMEMHSKEVISGGQGIVYAADTILYVSKRQEKEGTEISGYTFTLKSEKSRFVKEASKFPVTVTYAEGILPYSGLLDIAMEGGFVTAPKQGWYAKVDQETGEVVGKNYRQKELDRDGEFWQDILSSEKFKNFVKEAYALR